jgi:hypothetical protein
MLVQCKRYTGSKARSRSRSRHAFLKIIVWSVDNHLLRSLCVFRLCLDHFPGANGTSFSQVARIAHADRRSSAPGRASQLTLRRHSPSLVWDKIRQRSFRRRWLNGSVPIFSAGKLTASSGGQPAGGWGGRDSAPRIARSRSGSPADRPRAIGATCRSLRYRVQFQKTPLGFFQ